MFRFPSLRRGLALRAGVLFAAASFGTVITACNAFLDDFVYVDGGPGAQDATPGTDATTSDATSSADASPPGDGAIMDSSAGDGDAGGQPGNDASPETYSEAVLASDPVAYWRLGESQGATANSLTGGGSFAATYLGDITLGVPGAIGGDPDTAINFDGDVGAVRFNGEFPALDGEIFAIEMWIRPTVAPSVDTYRFLIKSVDPTTTLSFFYQGMPGDSLHAELSATNGGANDNATSDPPVGVWSYVVLQSNGLLFSLYLNTVLVAYMPHVAGTMPADGGSPLFSIGGDENGYSSFEGDIDEVAVYAAALTPAIMQLHYGLAGPHDAGP